MNYLFGSMNLFYQTPYFRFPLRKICSNADKTISNKSYHDFAVRPNLNTYPMKHALAKMVNSSGLLSKVIKSHSNKKALIDSSYDVGQTLDF